MKFLKQISVWVFAMLFLVSSVGIVLIKSNCKCTGNESVSLYLSPETCQENFHKKHIIYSERESNSGCTHGCCSENHQTHDCEECDAHMHDCGCSEPEAHLFQLKNQLIDEELEFVKVTSIQLFIVSMELNWLLLNQDTFIETYNFYVDPPPTPKSSLDFLIQIQQLKIAALA